MTTIGVRRPAAKAIHEALSSPRLWILAVPLAAVLVIVTLRFGAEPLRRELMIETPRPVAAAGEAPDARQEGDRFFAQRDSVLIRVPADIPVGEFIRLYHLRNTRGVREALRAQTGAYRDPDLIPEGSEIRLHLTVPSR